MLGTSSLAHRIYLYTLKLYGLIYVSEGRKEGKKKGSTVYVVASTKSKGV